MSNFSIFEFFSDFWIKDGSFSIGLANQIFEWWLMAVIMQSLMYQMSTFRIFDLEMSDFICPQIQMKTSKMDPESKWNQIYSEIVVQMLFRFISRDLRITNNLFMIEKVDHEFCSQGSDLEIVVLGILWSTGFDLMGFENLILVHRSVSQSEIEFISSI